MARQVFFSFHYDEDSWRTSQVRNIGAIESEKPMADNEWEELKEEGDDAVKEWIDEQLSGRSCTIVLIGSNTAGRKWINYEIKKTWSLGKGLFGIFVHNLKDRDRNQSEKGANPFSGFETDNDDPLDEIVPAHNPPYSSSNYIYDHIKENIEDWIEEAIEIRDSYYD